MIVYNRSTKVIFIHQGVIEASDGGPGRGETTYAVNVGCGIDLSILGLEPKGCPHPGCCCVCEHRGECPEDGPSLVSDVVD